jgi:hypothetical protein
MMMGVTEKPRESDGQFLAASTLRCEGDVYWVLLDLNTPVVWRGPMVGKLSRS